MRGADRGRAMWRLAERIAPGIKDFSRYEAAWLRSDLAAGLSVAAVALPVGVAYADLAGVPAVIGIYAAIFPLFAYALFGASPQLMTGPDAATCMLMAAALGTLAGGDTERYLALVIVMTLSVGLIYVLAGAARLGFIARFLSQPILVGFLNGIALLIIVGQLDKLLGYSLQAEDFLGKLAEHVARLPTAHPPTLILGLVSLAGLLALRRFTPRLPGALVVVIFGIVLAAALGLEQQGVAVLGAVPAGLPDFFQFPLLPVEDYPLILRDAAGLVLVSFTSGILTAKSFAQRNGYPIDPNRELFGFGAANLASGLAQGFPVTGADSRTAVNDAMGGKTQLVGIIAGGVMLAVLFFLTEPLAYVPISALAAVIIVSAAGLFDFAALRKLFAISRIELAFSVGTTLGVLLLGAIPGVLLAVILSLLQLLALSSRPADAVLGRVPGLRGFHDVSDIPEAKTVPGLLLYRFEASLVFYNVEYFRNRLLALISASKTPVEWVVLDAGSINVVDSTAIDAVDSTAIDAVDRLSEELAARGIVLASANIKRSLGRRFQGDWVDARRALTAERTYPTLKAAMRAFERRDAALGADDSGSAIPT
jgi:high affinity sulfate transporter 1